MAALGKSPRRRCAHHAVESGQIFQAASYGNVVAAEM